MLTSAAVRRGQCAQCLASIDVALHPARVIEGRVVVLCTACVHHSPRCLAAAAPKVEPSRQVEQSQDRERRSHGGRWRAVAMAGMGIAGILVLVAATSAGKGPPAASIAGAVVHDDAPVQSAMVAAVPDDAPRVGAPEALTAGGKELLRERFPSLAEWVHPVSSSHEWAPAKSSRRFGAARDGERPRECGRGHCGVDFAGPRGTPVVAVAWGVVTRVVRDPNRRSGRYVRVRHPEGVETSYMHLDRIAPGLGIGSEVEAGQALGTLGRTGIHHSEPHLHFSLALPRGSSMRYADPLPFVRGATTVTAELAPEE